MNTFTTFITFFLLLSKVHSFTTPYHPTRTRTRTKISSKRHNNPTTFIHLQNSIVAQQRRTSVLCLNAKEEPTEGTNTAVLSLSKSDQTVVGAIGIVMSIVMLYSEYVLKMTGCGLPAGPFGLVGAVEGLSYLGVIGLVSFSIYTKVTTVS